MHQFRHLLARNLARYFVFVCRCQLGSGAIWCNLGCFLEGRIRANVIRCVSCYSVNCLSRSRDPVTLEFHTVPTAGTTDIN